MSQQGQIMKFGAVMLENLPEISGDMMQYWIENPLELQGALAGLEKKPSPNLSVWKTIKLGTGLKTADDFRQALSKGGFRISDWAGDILGKPSFTVACEEIELDLVKVSVKDLGFDRSTRRDQIYERAKEHGLESCPAEVGPQLRLQYKDQPNGEWLLIAMEPILASAGNLHVFLVKRHASELWLSTGCGGPAYFWDLDDRWVFLRPRK